MRARRNKQLKMNESKANQAVFWAISATVEHLYIQYGTKTKLTWVSLKDSKSADGQKHRRPLDVREGDAGNKRDLYTEEQERWHVRGLEKEYEDREEAILQKAPALCVIKGRRLG